MQIRFPLYAKIVLWFFLNLLFLGVVFYVFFKVQLRLGLDSLLAGRTGDRIQAVSEVLAEELREAPAASWNQVLERFSRAYQVQFFLFRNDGTQVAGERIDLPEEVQAKLTERRGPGAGLGRGPPPGRGPRRAIEAGAVEPLPKFMLRSGAPHRYWVGVRLPLIEAPSLRPWPLTLLAMSSSIRGGGLFFDFIPWVVVGFGALLFSVLFWAPLVRGVTRSISQMTQATQEIAEGRFEARVPARRSDELGRLGQAINRMAGRLAGFVTGQKRFLGDIAHELCSPIARLQMALGILEQRAGEKEKSYVEDIREEVQHISDLVNELLSFSKASLRQKEIKLQPVKLADLARRVVAREADDPMAVAVQIDDSLCVLAEPELLSRALANLVRNALRYAGNAGPITVAAVANESQVTLSVSDQGPGVAPEALEQIFDPFFRLEASRSRDTGGVGLGLSIVKTCVEACQGTVSARNRQPSGLQVDIVLKASRSVRLEAPR